MAGPADPKAKRVLIVDDDVSVLNLLEILVKRDGFQVLLAETVEEALRQMTPPVDLVLLDLMLPNGSGLEVLERLRQNKSPAPPVIVVTAYGNQPMAQQVQRDPNVVQVMAKPINQEKLLALLHEVLKTQPRPKGSGPPPKEGPKT